MKEKLPMPNKDELKFKQGGNIMLHGCNSAAQLCTKKTGRRELRSLQLEDPVFD